MGWWKDAKARSASPEDRRDVGQERPWGGREVGTGRPSQDQHPP